MALVNSKIRLVKSKEQEEEEKKRRQEEERRKQAQSDPLYLPTFEELSAIEEKAKEDAAAAVSSEKGLDLFQRPSNWDDGYQFGDITKTALGTLGDIGVGAVKGVVRMGEGIGDAAQYGAAALADLFGADEKAEAIRQNAQRDKVTEAFSGVDEKLNKYSVLGRTSDAAAESLGQIGAIVGTAGIAGALHAGAVGTTAATTGLMGLSSFGSGTGEAYAAGADEGEAEAYGAIAGAADALSEMIFSGLGKGFKALGLSKGITSADDLLAKAVTSKIRNTLAKNAVQLGIKAGAEGLEEVLAGTMQAAGKKATYMSERDFADIIKDENLLEQFVVGAMASGISQTPSFFSATRAGVDLVSDGAAPESDSAQGAQDKFAALRDKNADFGEIERTGLASGANEDDIRMAGELSTALGKKIRFFREEAKNGTINNGEYHEDTDEIWINARSKNVKAQIVAHELTHSIEKNDGYRQLVDLTMNKLEAEQKAKGKTLDDLYREKETLYADGGVRLASYDEITSELVAEYVEKRLLTDEASIKSLVSENRTLGQRIREWFDSLLAKMGNASAKEREYIRQMRDVYERALGEDVGAGDDGVQHHISKTEKGQPFVTIDRDILAGVPKSDWQQTVVDNLTGKYPNGIKIGNQQIQITEQGIDEIAYSKQAQWLYKNDINTLTDKYRASDNADEIVRSAQGWINEGLNHKRKDDIVDFARGKTLIRVGKNDYEADVLVARLKNDDLMLYDIYNLSPTTIKEKETGTVMNSNPSPSGIRNPANISSGNSISQNIGNVKGGNTGNGQHSISAVDDEAVRKNTPGVKDAEETAQINEEIERVDPVTEAETDQTLQQIRNDIAADEARYRELSDTVMSNERFNAMMPDEQNAILDEMQSLRERIDRANQIMQDMSIEQDMGDDMPMPGDEDVPPQRRSAQAEYGEPETVEVAGEEDQKLTRKVLHKNIMDRIKERFSERGFDFDKVLAKAKDLSTFATVDNTPQRVMEKSLGYKEGRELSDLTIDQAAKNETEAIRWLNGFTDKKDGVLAKLSKKYNIKPGSKESAAAQMYAEGFYVSDKNEIVEYGDRELAADFPDAQVRENIKGLAHDPIIRQIYDETLDAINASRTRNAFQEIQKLDNYYLHFRAMDDTFSRLGIPFNPNDIRAKDLPTDLNGVTADLKPGQPYFASAKHRLGKRTSFDLLGGMEKYLTSAKNQIYHIDDIQTLRALRNYVADMYGQAEGLANLDDLSDEEVEARIKDVYGSHLSTFAKFLNEEANVLAGKTSLIDRGLEGVIGRRGITFLNDVNRQVGANMVGYNISSSLTNFLAPVQAFAKMNKAAFIKGFAQTVENRMKSITGNGDDFAEKSDVIVRRKGADRFHRTAWQKMSDPGYLLMGMVDDISTEIIARAKYNELTAKGMDAETANRETDKWVSRLMGDRSLGQMPQIFNSKMLGLVTKFQLEVRNQLDSQLYDTIKEAQAQYEEIGDKAKRNAKIAAKVTATLAELAIAQHLFGSVFESIAGYNPAFDIIEVIAKVIGLDDDEESEDTVLDNIEQGVLALIEDLPYSSVLMDGGRVPMSAALPISELVTGEDQYGNGDDRFGGALQRMKTVAEAVPYYALPGGYGQIKKTAKGLSMFSGNKEVTGSYTDSGNLRFPVEATPGNIAQAAVFGQWANENARDYFDNERKPANERQTIGYAESGLEWKEFQKYRDQISKLDRDADKLALIKSLDIDQTAKEALYRYLVASAKKDDDGNIIGSSEDERLAALYRTGLNFRDFADAKLKQAELNADTSLTANQRATRFYAWAASEGYTDEQADAITEQFKFSSGFKVEPTQYKKLIGGGVSPENAVLVTDALTGASRAIDKINAVWSTGLSGKQLDNAVKAVVTEGWYERYRKVVDANVPLDVLTWVLDNADANGNDSIDNEERTLILSQLALSRKELSALWEATGGSEKSNPYSGSNKSGGISVKIEMPKIEMPKIEMPKIELPKIGG